MTTAADLNAQTAAARIMQAAAPGAGGRSTRSRTPIRKPAATPAAPAAAAAAQATGGPSAYRVRHGTSDEQVIAEVREHAKANEWMMDLTDQQILDAIGWAYLPGSAVKRIRPPGAVAPA